MTLVSFLIALVIMGLIWWLVTTYIPLPPPIKTIITVVMVLIIIIMLLSVFGLANPFGNVRIS